MFILIKEVIIKEVEEKHQLKKKSSDEVKH